MYERRKVLIKYAPKFTHETHKHKQNTPPKEDLLTSLRTRAVCPDPGLIHHRPNTRRVRRKHNSAKQQHATVARIVHARNQKDALQEVDKVERGWTPKSVHSVLVRLSTFL